MRQFKLGDVIEKALSAVGVTEERVTKALGRPCGCKERREKLNRLSLWAARVVTGRPEDDDPDFYAREDYAANDSRSIFTGY